MLFCVTTGKGLHDLILKNPLFQVLSLSKSNTIQIGSHFLSSSRLLDYTTMLESNRQVLLVVSQRGWRRVDLKCGFSHPAACCHLARGFDSDMTGSEENE